MKPIFASVFRGRVLVALTLFSIVLGAQAADENSRNVLANGKESTFAFEWQKGMIFVPVRINGSKPLSFVLDSGSTRMIVDRTLAAKLGLKPSGQGSLQGAGSGRISIEFIQNVSISLPGLESIGYEFSTPDLQPLQASVGVRVDGILGY